MADIKATPAAAKLAEDNGVDLSKVEGTGAKGQVTKGNVEDFLADMEREAQDAAAEAVDETTAKAAKGKNAKGRSNAKKKAKASKKEIEKQRKADEREAKRKAREEEKAARKKAREEAKAKKEAEKKAREEQKAKKDAEAFEQFEQIEPEAARISLSDVAPWDTAGAKRSTTESVRHLGAITAVTVKRLTDEESKANDGAKYRVVDGARRLSDYAEEGVTEFPATILPADTPESTLAAATFLANAARSGNVIHEAEGMRTVMEATGWNQSDLSNYTGVALPTISKTLKVLQLPADFYTATKEGKIGASVAMELVNLSPEQMDKAREIFAETGTLKVKDIRAIRRADKEEAVSTVDAEGMESDGTGEYTGGTPNNPENAFKNAARKLLDMGLTSDDLTEMLASVIEDASEIGEETVEA